MTSRRLLAVHAHPDDESISSGGTLARYAAEGVEITLVTATLGEEGEILPAWLAGLAADRADQLGGYRLAELAAATAALGVPDWCLLGGVGHWRDSGMAGTAANDHPRAFVRADLDEAAGALADVIAETRPQVVITYDEHGGYGHPDHLRTVQVTLRAVELARGMQPVARAWSVARVWGAALALSARPALRPLAGDPSTADLPGPGDLAGIEAAGGLSPARPDDQIDAAVDVSAYGDRKRAALAAHATQVDLREDTYALSNGRRLRIPTVEHYVLLGGAVPFRRAPGDPWATDLFPPAPE